ncbi:MAG: universal stress protein [Vicinamibacteria bacterium]|nr:universal stress protein [Vicinamibacteria bacterium]
MTPNPVQIERILFPTDFSPFSSQALRHALALTRKFDARLKVLHVIPQMIQPGDSIYAAAPWLLTPEARQRTEDEMRLFLVPVREARIDHEIEISEGDPWREILASAEQTPADLVVMGTHGRSGLERLFLGSVAEKLIRRLPCSVLTLSHEEGRTWETPGLVTRILCATDFSATSSEALHFALTLAEKNDAEVTLLHVIENVPESEDPRFPANPALSMLREESERLALERLQEAIREADGKTGRVVTRVAVGRAYQEILKLAALEQADLIVVGAQGHGPIEHLLSGSNAQHVIRRATCPVLTARPLQFREDSQKARPGSLALAVP